MDRAIPHLRITDYDEAVGFYVGVLGFKINFEWRHEPGFPVYMGIEHGTLFAHLSEHDGSGQPGNGRGMTLQVKDIDGWYERVRATGAKLEDELTEQPWGLKDFSLDDPFGNHILVMELKGD